MVNPWMEIGNSFMKLLLRSPLHRMISESTLLLIVSGKKSGKKYTLPVNYVRDDNTLYISSPRNRTWWRNLRGGAPVTISLQGREVKGEGLVVEERSAQLENLKHLYHIRPDFARYLGSNVKPNGQPDVQELFRVANERVIVKVRLNGERYLENES
jgi:hypothetical protein